MTEGESKLREFGTDVDSLIKSRNLSRKRIKEMMRQVLFCEQPRVQCGAFLAAITAKGPTADEVAGCWEAIYEHDTPKVSLECGGQAVENSGTGMDNLKTFNISTGASIVAASCGILIARHAARSITSKCGAVDISEALGVDVDCGVDIVKRSIERCGIGVFNGMSPVIHPRLAGVLSKVRFGSILNIAASLSNPVMPKYGLRGVCARELVLPVTEVMREVGYRHAMVVHGISTPSGRGIDEVSTLGETYVTELHRDGSIDSYTITPAEAGIAQLTDESAVAASFGPDSEAEVMMRMLSGLDGRKAEMVAINAGSVLYVAGKADSIREGVEISMEAIRSGTALDKLKDWVREQNSDPEKGMDKLRSVAERLGMRAGFFT